MLVEFSVTNYKSIAEKQTFSMAAGSAKSKLKPHAFETGNSYAPKLMRSACVFGPNGAGKSSLIEALSFFKQFVISSAKESQEGESIDVVPFALCDDYRNAPSEFEMVFIFNDHLYQYGFSVDHFRIVDEWLFAKPNKPRTTLKELFQRNYNPDTGQYDWATSHIKGQKEVWKDATRDNALFLSTAIMLRSEALQEPFTWLRKQLKVIKSTERLTDSFTIEQVAENDRKEAVLNFLKAADLGIDDLEINSVNTEGESVEEGLAKFFEAMEAAGNNLPANGSFQLKLQSPKAEDLKKMELVNVLAVHKGRNNKDVKIDLQNESDGTKVIFSLAGPLLHVLENGLTLFVDELHNSLHPHALRFLVEMFLNPKTNKNNAQLIFTSHETSIMARNFLHRDQVWLMEKEDGATCLFPLSDFKGRDYEAFQRAYLDGRYGGVPRIGEVVNG
ncbi:conserved hypothetical protein [Candidatus Terasakiella magnetica]|uniref:ATPase AAA-type core domain-containing protein n=1 Tax=Candidatus Terasakiella magnetica TaxID=1867952 RepID=A0A1C3RER9_9PROT|nr:ATP-binding protein [Candidatus Terasakiella magnetica]SCA55796.1 conserved hypothetical protein [Candidatus Terasakiella magnetica]